MFSFLISFVTLAVGAFGAAWFMQGREQQGKPFGKLMGIDTRYVIGGGLALAGALLSAIFPPIGLVAMGAAGAAIGSAAAEKRVEVQGAGGGGSGFLSLAS